MSGDLEKTCTELRNQIRDLGTSVLALKAQSVFGGEELFVGQQGEMKANIMLSFRHLEDARMRIGKVMQQIQGGISIFDREEQNRNQQTEGG